jgi:hypothetical protein
LIDQLLLEAGDTKFSSLLDARVFLGSRLEDWVQISTSKVITNFEDRLASKLYLFKNSNCIQKDTKIGKLLKIAERSLTIKNPLISQSYIGNESTLCITAPDFDENDEPTASAVAQLVTLACALHATKPSMVSINKDSTVGDSKITISGSLIKLIDSLTASALHPQGLYPGEVLQFASGFKGNGASILAAMRLLNSKSEFLRKRKFPKDSGKSSTSYNVLQETFNLKFGIKTDSSMPYTQSLFKAILSSCVRPHNKGFPGGWIHSARAINGVKSDFAVSNLLGWTEKVPSQHKLLEVMFNTVDPASDTTGLKKDTVVNITKDKRQFSTREFRTAVALSLPRLNRRNGDFDKSLSLDPFSHKSLVIANNFCSDRRDSLVDCLNESYGLRVSLKNPKSKTREIHYKNSRDRLLAASANIPLVDGEGKKYSSFSDLPKNIQSKFREIYRYPLREKRVRDTDVVMESTQLIHSEAGNAEEDLPSAKKQKKVSRGMAAELGRRSGRLAALKNKPAK